MIEYLDNEIEEYNPFDQYEENDYDDDHFEEERDRYLEQQTFSSVPKHGFHAHAYKKKLDNLMMMKLREEGKTYRAIAKQLGCSPSTVRNRIKKIDMKKNQNQFQLKK